MTIELTFTDKAKEKARFYMKDKSLSDWGIRILAKGHGDFGFSMVELSHVADQDEILEIDDFKVVVDDISVRQLNGAKVDFLEDETAHGFAVERPHQEAPPPPDLNMDDPVTKKVYDVLMKEINPGIASHGGFARLIGIKDSVVYLQFGGGCHGCGMVDVTLKQGIETRIKELIPEVKAVSDITDHSTGENPYFQA